MLQVIVVRKVIGKTFSTKDESPFNSSSTTPSISGTSCWLLKLKGSLREAVSPQKVNDALLYLKANNMLYRDVHIDMEQIPIELLTLDENEEIEIDVQSEVATELETEPNPLDQFRQPAVESFSLPLNSPQELLELAPGENKSPHCLVTDEFCEVLAFPKLFPKGRFGYKVKREVSSC